MKLSHFLLGAAVGLLAACTTPVNTANISTVPATATQMAAARQAASICAANAPDWQAVEMAAKVAGFQETGDQKLKGVARAQDAVILEDQDRGVVVLIGSRRKEGACIVGSRNMTPQQSYELALPWVRKYAAVTNAERGQGLANDVVQAWASLEEDRNVYIAAYKTWELLDAPGSAARLLYISR